MFFSGLPDDLPDTTFQSLRCWPDAGLNYPFIPPEFAADTHALGEWAWAWQPRLAWGGDAVVTPEDAYLQFPERMRFVAGDWRPRFMVCHFGHGMNSYGLNYVIVTQRLALLAQVGWGGYFMDEDTSSRAVDRLGDLVEEVHRRVHAPSRWRPGRLVVVGSSFRGDQAVAWASNPGREPRPVRGIMGKGLHGALEFMAHRG